MASAKDIKKWLKNAGKNRDWLAQKTLVSKSTVNGWLSAGKPIPIAKIALIERLMQEEEEITIPPDIEKQLRAMADEMQKSIEDMVSYILRVTARDSLQNIDKTEKEESSRSHYLTEETELPSSVAEEPPASTLGYSAPVIGNIAAGGLQPGDSLPFTVRTNRPLDKDEYLLRVEGKSMEPFISDGSLVVMRKHVVPPIPKVGTIVEYNDERGVTLKKLAQKITPETGEKEYILLPINPDYGEIYPMDGGRISGVYVETLDQWKRA